MKKELTYEELQAENKRLQERIAQLERQLFGSKSDKRSLPNDPNQLTLFDEECKEAQKQKEAETEAMKEEIRKESEKRRNTSKKPLNRPEKYLYSGLEERVREELPEDINLDEYDVIGYDETRILHQTPAQLWVECIRRPKLRKKSEKKALYNSILQAPTPKAIIGGGHVAADFLAKLITDKFVYHLPEYRQVKMYADLGVKLPTSTINDWVHAVANKLYPLYESQMEAVLSESDYIQIDEVPWRIADQSKKSRHGYAWQLRDARSNSTGLFFYYNKGSRSGAIPRALLKDYRGALQTDGYGVYDFYETIDNVTLLGCMAHVRRKFIEAQSAFPALSAMALDYIGMLYEIEANLKAREATEEEIYQERQKKAMPILEEFEAWMQLAQNKCTPQDAMGKAIIYTYRLYPRLTRYTLNGRYHIDNNDVERGQRPSVMGRKNYLFSKNDRGAEDNAIFYTLLESCDVAGINKIEWLEYVLNHLTEDATEDELIDLLPYNYKTTQG